MLFSIEPSVLFQNVMIFSVIMTVSIASIKKLIKTLV